MQLRNEARGCRLVLLVHDTQPEHLLSLIQTRCNKTTSSARGRVPLSPVSSAQIHYAQGGFSNLYYVCILINIRCGTLDAIRSCNVYLTTTFVMRQASVRFSWRRVHCHLPTLVHVIIYEG